MRRVDKPLVIYNKGGFLATKHQYLISYKGFAFYTKASVQIDLPRSAEVIISEKIWIPS
jgi:hypothetical protein